MKQFYSKLILHFRSKRVRIKETFSGMLPRPNNCVLQILCTRTNTTTMIFTKITTKDRKQQ